MQRCPSGRSPPLPVLPVVSSTITRPSYCSTQRVNTYDYDASSLPCKALSMPPADSKLQAEEDEQSSSIFSPTSLCNLKTLLTETVNAELDEQHRNDDTSNRREIVEVHNTAYEDGDELHQRELLQCDDDATDGGTGSPDSGTMLVHRAAEQFEELNMMAAQIMHNR
eukprot:4448207-Pyramimonas_sp.AAC.1